MNHANSRKMQLVKPASRLRSADGTSSVPSTLLRSLSDRANSHPFLPNVNGLKYGGFFLKSICSTSDFHFILTNCSAVLGWGGWAGLLSHFYLCILGIGPCGRPSTNDKRCLPSNRWGNALREGLNNLQEDTAYARIEVRFWTWLTPELVLRW